MMYVVTVDWYTEEEGYQFEVVCVCNGSNVELAHEYFEREVKKCKEVDEWSDWTVDDDTPWLYFAHGTCPEYCRVTLSQSWFKW